VEARLATRPPCLIGMGACVGAHHLSRRLSLLGHDARLMPAKYVRAGPTSRSPLSRAARAVRRWAIPRAGNRCPADPHLPSPARSRRRRLAIHGLKPGSRCAAESGASNLSRRRGSIIPRPPTSFSSDQSPRSQSGYRDGRGDGRGRPKRVIRKELGFCSRPGRARARAAA
jgi:hypothetical protein